MTDLHSHVLYNIDDGPATLQQSLILINACSATGVKTIACTSHYYSGKVSFDEFVDRRDRRIKEISTYLERENIDVRLISSAEVHMSEVLLSQKNIDALCYGNSNYILLEIPSSEVGVTKPVSYIERVMSYYRKSPIVAHIERYKYLFKNSKNLSTLKNMGCLLQVDAGVIADGSFLQRRRVLSLIKQGLVDIIASDCHDCQKRRPNLSEAYDIIESKLGKSVVDKLKANCEMVVNSAV